jgi:sec-independent protein translocase protein TatC
MMIHHVKEIQIRFLVVAAVLILGMIVGYLFHEPLFAFIKAPLNGPLHYTSPSGSFTFIINICMLIGVIATLPVLVYNVIMFAQPALEKRLSKARVYLTTFFSLVLAGGGGAFAFLIIIPLALRFFYKFQVDGLVALISADDYLRFVVNVIITFVLMFQLPLFISLFDHIKPLPPKKLFKAEKFIILGSIVIAIIVPFAVDPTVQLLIASPIIILYNLSIVVVLLQHRYRSRSERKRVAKERRSEAKQATKTAVPAVPAPALMRTSPVAISKPTLVSASQQQALKRRMMQDISSPGLRRPLPVVKKQLVQPQVVKRPLVRPQSVRIAERPNIRTPRLISDVRPLRNNVRMQSSAPQRKFPLSPVAE